MRAGLLAALLFFGCTFLRQKEGFVLPNKQYVECLRYVQEECGITLLECSPWEDESYHCLPSVIYEGPVDTD